jgi:hypothetical protein
MTDHKASIKIEFTIYGETAKMDSWINWSPHDSQCFPIDQRVIDFFDTAYDKARRGYDERLHEAERESLDREKEREERAELARLKAKYESPDQP